MKILPVIFLAFSLVAIPTGIFAEDTIFTPLTLIETLEIVGADPQLDEDNKRIATSFAGDDLRRRKVVMERAVTNYSDGLSIITIPVPSEKESETWSFISYEVRVVGKHPLEEQPNMWRTTKYPQFGKTKQHIWFVFKINMLIPTNELINYVKDYQARPVRKYEGSVSYKIFKVRKDLKGIPLEDFMQRAETLYVEIDIDITKVDGKELKTP